MTDRTKILSQEVVDSLVFNFEDPDGYGLYASELIDLCSHFLASNQIRTDGKDYQRIAFALIADGILDFDGNIVCDVIDILEADLVMGTFKKGVKFG